MKRHTKKMMVPRKTLTKPVSQSSCGQLGGASQPKTAYLMLVPEDETHKQGETISLGEGVEGTINQLVDVEGLTKFDSDDKLKGARPNKEAGKSKIILGKVDDKVKTYINGNIQEIIPNKPIKVKYNQEIELYKAITTLSTNNSENSATGFNVESIAKEEETEPVSEIVSPTVPSEISTSEGITETQLNNLRSELQKIISKSINTENLTRYVLTATKKNIIVKKNDAEICSMPVVNVGLITLENLTKVYSAFSTLGSNCVFFVYKYNISEEDTGKNVYIVFNKYTTPQILQYNSPVYLNSEDCNKQGEKANSYIISPDINELSDSKYFKEDVFNADKYFNEKLIKQKGGKRTTLKRKQKLSGKHGKTLKRKY
jgi:hypothetical protein